MAETKMADTTSAPAPEADNFLKCPGCSNILCDPVTFLCLHTFCGKCADNYLTPEPEMDKKEETGNNDEEDETGSGIGSENGETGNDDNEAEPRVCTYTCPLCQQITPQTELSTDPFIALLLERYHVTRGYEKGTKCQRCTKEEATWCCMDSEAYRWLCDTCKAIHDEFIKHQQAMTIDELLNQKHAIDKPLYCTKHPKMEVTAFCLDTQQPICPKCEMSTHKGHRIEPIADAIQRFVDQITANRNKLQSYVRDNEQVLSTADTTKERVIAPFTKEQSDLDRKLEEDIAELRAQHKEASDKLSAQREAAVTLFEDDMQNIRNITSRQKQGIQWVDATVAKAKGATLLWQLYYRGLLKKIDYVVADPGYGGYKDEESICVHASRNYPWPFPRVTEEEYEDNTDRVIDLRQLDVDAITNCHYDVTPFSRIAVMSNSESGNEIWIVFRSDRKIARTDLAGRKLADIRVPVDDDECRPRHVIPTGINEGALITQKGLFAIDGRGNIGGTGSVGASNMAAKIDDGDIADACLAPDGVLYSLHADTGIIRRFRRRARKPSSDDVTWQRISALSNEKEIELEDYEQWHGAPRHSRASSMLVTDTDIFVANTTYAVVRYTKTGKLIQVYGTESYYNKIFDSPAICGIDSDGVLLVSSFEGGWLQRIKPDGTRMAYVRVADMRRMKPLYAVCSDKDTFWLLSHDFPALVLGSNTVAPTEEDGDE